MTDRKYSPLQIIHVTSKTAQTVEHVAEDVFDHPINSGQLNRFLQSPDAAMFVGVIDQQVVGQVRGFIHCQPDGPPDLYIDNLGVTPSRKRQGIATKLMTAILDWAREAGCEGFWLLTEPENEEGLGFYEALGLKHKTSVFFEGKV